MKYFDCYKKQTPVSKRAIMNTFRRWINEDEEYRQKLRNLFNEHFLPDYIMDQIFNVINSSLKNQFNIVHNNLVDHARNNLNQGGKSILPLSVLTVGSVIPRRRFFNYLKQFHFSLFEEEKEINNFIEDLCTNTKSINPKYENIPLKDDNRLIWMTWDNIDYTNNPFFFLKNKYAEEALTALGLGYPNYKNTELLAFSFITSSRHLYRPTICDSDYNNYWRPTLLVDNDYGIIKPLNDGIYFILENQFEISKAFMKLPESTNFGSFYIIKNIISCNPLF